MNNLDNTQIFQFPDSLAKKVFIPSINGVDFSHLDVRHVLTSSGIYNLC